MNRLLRMIATLGPVGFFPVAPATLGSAVTAAIAWFVPVQPWPVVAALFVAGSALAVWSAGVAEHTLGHDAGPIIIDEVIGQSLALLFVPHRVLGYVAAFLLFRLFDIWKPLGAYEAQRLPGGWGVVTDDVIAGITACAAFQLAALAARPLFPHLL